MANILIVEDEPVIVELIRVTLEADSHHIVTAASAEEAFKLLRQSTPDVILLDWMLPGQTGLSFAKMLRDHRDTRSVPIIMVTARSAEADKVAGLETSVDDYVTKPFSPRELRARVKAVLRRHAPELVGSVLRSGTLTLDPGAHRVHVNDTEVPLGPLEFRLLHYLMARMERVFTRAQLLDAIWGQDAEIEERTVDVLVRRLRAALAEHGRDGAIETVRGSGYRFNGHAND